MMRKISIDGDKTRGLARLIIIGGLDTGHTGLMVGRQEDGGGEAASREWKDGIEVRVKINQNR
jgi:hypothetical protein